jgi:hypothetical protein
VKIQLIVEGHGEVGAFPVLVRRLRDEAGNYEMDFGRPIRRKRSELVVEQQLVRAIELALLTPDCAAILVLLDADDDCPAKLGPQLQAWAEKACRGRVPCAVVLAMHEYEAWILAGLSPPHPDPEGVRGAKEEVARRRDGGYIPSADQAPLSAIIDLDACYQACRSFRRLVRSIGLLAEGIGSPIASWPPPAWSKSS